VGRLDGMGCLTALRMGLRRGALYRAGMKKDKMGYIRCGTGTNTCACIECGIQRSKRRHNESNDRKEWEERSTHYSLSSEVEYGIDAEWKD
jgi:hypothetical protein